MANLRSVSWVSQQRVDVSDMRSIDSAIRNDYDALIEGVITGTTTPLVVRGFEISMAGAIGGAASGLQMIVDPGALLHITASQSGTFYLTPTGTPPAVLNSALNVLVDGAFAPNSVNYVGIDYDRYLDPSTSAVVYLWDPSSNDQFSEILPRGQILRYRFEITQSTWATTTLPIAIVTTDAGNNVTSITDSRNLLCRLGKGGASPDPFYVYPWTAQPEGRTENPPTSTSNAINPFEGGDKMLANLKDWMDAIMSSLLEIKGTTYWYSALNSGSLSSLREDLQNTFITGKGHVEHSASIPGLINWDQNIYIRVIGSNLSYEILANPSSSDITLTDLEAAYITLVRNVPVVPNLIFTNGSAIVTSVGAVAWTSLLTAGDLIKLSADSDSGYYEILSVNSLSQVTLVANFTETSTGVSGAVAEYAFGSYAATATPSGPRDIFIAPISQVPVGPNTFWLFARSDNGGSVAKVYIKFLGMELQQGETEEIADGTPQQLLQYVGSPIETAFAPQYVSALDPGAVPQINTASMGAESTYAGTSEYFLINSAGNIRKYYVWFQLNGIGSDPAPAGTFGGIQVNLVTGDSANTVATKTAAAINSIASAYFTAVPSGNLVRITNTSAGTCTAGSNFNVSAPFTITNTQTGTGSANFFIEDGDNLTLAIKKLDEAVGSLSGGSGVENYEEFVTIVASGASPPNTLNGPISSGTIINLPNNSRLGNTVETYTVGSGMLQVFLNGQYTEQTVDWVEVGSSNSQSNSIQILEGLVVGDYLTFRINASGQVGPSGAPGPQGNPGPPGMPALGTPINVSTKTSNYTVTLSDVVLLADCTSGPITFTLPSAASAVGYIFFFKKIDSTSNALSIQGQGSETIDGNNIFQPPLTIQYMSITLVSNGAAFFVL